jgi:SAM-dependent methyltransferase
MTVSCLNSIAKSTQVSLFISIIFVSSLTSADIISFDIGKLTLSRSEASNYDANHRKTGDYLIASLQANLSFINAPFLADVSSDSEDDENVKLPSIKGVSLKLLDYASGTGLISRALMQHCTSAVGIDLSDAMVSEYNKAASNQGLNDDEMHAYTGNLIDPSDPSPEAFRGEKFWNFDLAAVGLGFHHFEDPVLAAARLVERLKKDGVLLIIDFLPHEGFGHHHHDHHHGHGEHVHKECDSTSDIKEASTESKTEMTDKEAAVAATVHHLGFSESDVERIFVEAGAGKDFAYMVLGKGVVIGPADRRMKREVFMARGTKI